MTSAPDSTDLAALLAAALIANRDEINASRLAHGCSGRVEINVNLTMQRIELLVLVHETRGIA